MIIAAFQPDDIEIFLNWAAAENWLSDRWEFDFLMNTFSHGCFTARDDDGKIAGFVTALQHHYSGWIGNLIVAPGKRGQGIGEQLFLNAMKSLQTAGVETIWLTASKAGQSLYEKHGFSSIDTILRWTGTGRLRRNSATTADSSIIEQHLLHELDSRGWGDRRIALLKATSACGELLWQDSGCIVVRTCGDIWQLGPFPALESTQAEELLLRALNRIPAKARFCLDAPESNRAATRLFRRKKLHISGSNQLMYAGVKPAYRPEYIYGLATMGSCG